MDQIFAVILGLTHRYDYQEYVAASEKAGITYWSLADFAQKVGLLQVGMFRHPELTPTKAFLQLLVDLNEEARPATIAAKVKTPRCCGGGEEL